MRKPTKQQEEFIAAFIETRNATEAARRAGYKHPEVRGAEQLQKPHVRAKIDAIDARAADELVLTDKWIIERLMIEAVGETDAPVPEDSEGRRNQERRIVGAAASRVSALKTLADIKGLRSTTVKHEGNVDLTVAADDARAKLHAAAARFRAARGDGGVSQRVH